MGIPDAWLAFMLVAGADQDGTQRISFLSATVNEMKATYTDHSMPSDKFVKNVKYETFSIFISQMDQTRNGGRRAMVANFVPYR